MDIERVTLVIHTAMSFRHSDTCWSARKYCNSIDNKCQPYEINVGKIQCISFNRSSPAYNMHTTTCNLPLHVINIVLFRGPSVLMRSASDLTISASMYGLSDSVGVVYFSKAKQSHIEVQSTPSLFYLKNISTHERSHILSENILKLKLLSANNYLKMQN